MYFIDALIVGSPARQADQRGLLGSIAVKCQHQYQSQDDEQGCSRIRYRGRHPSETLPWSATNTVLLTHTLVHASEPSVRRGVITGGLLMQQVQLLVQLAIVPLMTQFANPGSDPTGCEHSRNQREPIIWHTQINAQRRYSSPLSRSLHTLVQPSRP